MPKYRIMVKVPVSQSPGAAKRTTEATIEARDGNAARSMAQAQYGAENVIGLPIEIKE